MTAAISSWLAITILLGIIATLAVWARGFSRARGLAVAAFVSASPIAAGALGAALGWPVPLVNGLNSPAGEFMVLGVKMLVGKGIYVLLDNSELEPRYYWMPWSREMADKIQEEIDKPNEGLKMIVPPFEWSWEKRPSFYALPQPKVMPDKPAQQAPNKFERSA